jgi:hypothetical protein
VHVSIQIEIASKALQSQRIRTQPATQIWAVVSGRRCGTDCRNRALGAERGRSVVRAAVASASRRCRARYLDAGRSRTIFSIAHEGRPRWDLDFFWEPSNYLQSYSFGGAYHPWDRVLFIGGRIRWMQLHPPFSRGFHARRDNQPGLGPEIGVRLAFGREQTFLPFASFGAIFFPSATISLPPMYTLNAGIAFGL